jgi:hypothetical protein
VVNHTRLAVDAMASKFSEILGTLALLAKLATEAIRGRLCIRPAPLERLEIGEWRRQA